VLGDGKTWRGTAAGIAAGALVALGLNALRDPATASLGVAFPRFPPSAAVALPLGAMVGDMGASFLKRRTGRKRGAPFPGVDQFDFVVGALAVTAAAAPGWFVGTFTPSVLAVVLVATPLLHVGTNAAAYALSLKSDPW